MEQSLSLNQSQRLAMTAKLQQAIRILQLSSQDLRTTIENEYLENPALELEEASAEPDAAESSEDRYSIEEIAALANYLGDDERQPHASHDPITQRFEAVASTGITLEQELMEQVNFTFHAEKERGVATFIVGSIDTRGYLQTPCTEIARAMQTDVPMVERVLKIIQGFEPSGVGARSLPECLRIQARQQGIYDGLVAAVIDRYLDAVASARYKVIASAEKCSLTEVQLAVDIIRTLNPKPGSSYGGDASDYILPDVVVRRAGDDYVVIVNDSRLPRLHISPVYRHHQDFDADTKKYIEQRVNSAAWLIRSIEQRRQTLFNVVTDIVKQQRDYLDKGPQYLHPLLMKTVAEHIGVHESTVSRAVANKYVEMPHGVVALKKFFTANIAAGKGGEELIARQVKQVMETLLQQENPKKPLSDQQISNLLKQQQMDISRRTVMKYREQMGYASSVKRKRY